MPVDHSRGQTNAVTVEDQFPVARDAVYQSQMQQIQQRIEVLQAHLEQCYDERAILAKSLCESRTTREVAVLLGCSQPNVIYMLQRARTRKRSDRG